MERAGVDRAVLVPLSHHDEYVRDCLALFPGRFAAIGLQSPGDFDVDGYRRRRDAVGLQGLRMFELGDASITDPDQLACFRLLAEFAHSGDKLWFYGGEAQMALLEHILSVLTELTVVLNHLGYWPSALSIDEHGRPRFSAPYAAEDLAMVKRLARFPNVFVLLSGLYAFSVDPWPYQDLRWVTAGLLEAYGVERLLLASDFPWIVREPGYAETIETLDAHFPHLGHDERSQIRGSNAARLFGFQ